MFSIKKITDFQERDPLEGPIPHLETRLCILLSVVPLSIAKLLNMEMQLNSNLPVTTVSGNDTGYGHDISVKARFPRKHGLVLALQVLGQFSSLVCPPESVVDAANTAATKAARFIRSSRNEDRGADFDHYDQGFIKAGMFRSLKFPMVFGRVCHFGIKKKEEHYYMNAICLFVVFLVTKIL